MANNPLKWNFIRDNMEQVEPAHRATMESTLAMTAFVRAIERNGFSQAARDLGVTPSAVSKLVTRLERRLGVVLVRRTTRRLALTPEGEVFFERAHRIVDAIADAEAEVMRFGERPRGKLRMNVGTAFGTYALVPALPEFQARYPEIELEISLTDRVVDLMDAGADLAIRLGPLTDTHLVARRLTDLTRVVSAAPAYLARHGKPATPGRSRAPQLPDHRGDRRPEGVAVRGAGRRARRRRARQHHRQQRRDALRARAARHGHHPAVGHHRGPGDPRRAARAAADGLAPPGGAAALRRLRVRRGTGRSRSAR